jgi:hypothetical protein
MTTNVLVGVHVTGVGHGGKESVWTSDPAAATFEDQLHLALTAHSIVRQD